MWPAFDWQGEDQEVIFEIKKLTKKCSLRKKNCWTHAATAWALASTWHKSSVEIRWPKLRTLKVTHSLDSRKRHWQARIAPIHNLKKREREKIARSTLIRGGFHQSVVTRRKRLTGSRLQIRRTMNGKAKFPNLVPNRLSARCDRTMEAHSAHKQFRLMKICWFFCIHLQLQNFFNSKSNINSEPKMHLSCAVNCRRTLCSVNVNKRESFFETGDQESDDIVRHPAHSPL